MVKYSLIEQRNMELMYLKMLQWEQFKRIRKDIYHQKRKKNDKQINIKYSIKRSQNIKNEKFVRQYNQPTNYLNLE